MIGLEIDIRGLDEVQRKLKALPAELRDKALQPAINRTAERGRAEINRAIPQEFAVKASEVRNAVDIRKSSRGSLRAEISVFGSSSKRGRSMNLIRFLAAYQAAGQAIKTRGARVSRAQLAGLEKQLGFLIKRGGGVKKIEGAFVGNKGRTVLIREGKARLPIKPLQVIGFSQMFNTKRISARVMAKINADLPTEVDRAIAAVLARNVLK